MIDRALTPIPRETEGYEAARENGSTPATPADPPSPLPGPSADRLLKRLGFTLVLSVLAALLALAVLPTPERRMPVPTAAALLVVLVIGGLVSRRALVAFRSRLLDELQAGYTTTTFQQGGFWLAHRDGRFDARGWNIVGWDWRGLWVTDGSGGVISTPDRTLDPPGLYPSPHSPGERELWTGFQWTFVYPDRRGGSGSNERR